MRRLISLPFALLLLYVYLVPQLVRAADPTFTTKDYPAGASPGKMVTADFNRDGVPDLAVITAGGVTVLLGNGDGSFRSPATFATGAAPIGLAVGDMNGDGIPDIVTGSNAGAGVSILLGTGNGSFRQHVDFAVPSTFGAVDVAVADFNGDGKLDVLAAGGQVFVLYGNGDGTLRTPQQMGTTPFGGAEHIIAGDFNGDGRPDVIYTDCCDPQTTAAPVGNDVMLINTGNGGFTEIAQGDARVFAIAALNANSDNVPDLATSYAGCHTPCVGGDVYIGQQGMSFPPRVAALAIPDPDQPLPGTAVGADFNGDGKIDIAYAITSFNSFSDPITATPRHTMLIMPGTGGAAWSDTPIVVNLGPALNANFTWSVTADFNNDGKPDIATVNPDAGVITVMLNSTGGSSGSGDFTLSLSPHSATVTRGQSATTKITVAPQNGFSGTVTFTCSGLPAGASCNFNPASVTGASSSTLTITTAAASSAALHRTMPGGATLALAVLGLTLVVPSGQRHRRTMLLAFIVLAVLVGLVACGGVTQSSGGNPSPTPTPAPPGGTPAGSYTVTVTANGGSVQHSTNFGLTVQ